MLLVGVVDVMVLLMLLVLPGVVAGAGLGDVNAASGDADGDGVRVRVAVPGVGGPWALFSDVLFLPLAGGAAGAGWWCCWRLFVSPAGFRGDAGGEGAIGDILCSGRGGVWWGCCR